MDAYFRKLKAEGGIQASRWTMVTVSRKNPDQLIDFTSILSIPCRWGAFE
jgi:hypothetical protein